MLTTTFRGFLLRLLLLGLPAYYPLLAAAQDQPVYTHAEQMPEFLGDGESGGGEAALHEALQRGIVLPFGTPVPAASSQVVVRFVVGTLGEISDASMVRGLSPAVDGAVLEAVHHLSQFRAAMQEGKYVRVAITVTIQAPGATTAAQRREATTRWQRTAQRQPGEADTTFVRRVLPLSYSSGGPRLLAYAWRPSAFGKQLFFSRPSGDNNEYGEDLFVLDPYQADTYAVQVLDIPPQGDYTTLEAIFFADANHDGRKDLIAISRCDLREEVKLSDGEYHTGRFAHYQTLIWRYQASGPTGPPQYQQAPDRSDLNELATVAEVRDALAAPPPRRPAPTKAKTARLAKPPK